MRFSYVVAAGWVATSLIFSAFSWADSQETESAGGQQAQILSAFFGLDNSLPLRANGLCPGAAGQDGMPIVLSHTIDPKTLQADDILVVTRSGAETNPFCVTLRPAHDPDELRTVLLIGEFGDAEGDPPAKVLIVGDLFSDGFTDEAVNFRGTQTQVTPLDAGPFLVLAQSVPVNGRSAQTPTSETATAYRHGSMCPEGIQQVIRVTWAGGVRLPGGNDLSDAERSLYRVTVEHPDGSRNEIEPVAIADLGDRDNNHLLCLDTSDPAVFVSFPGGHLVDPNQDLNSDTRVAVNHVSR